MNTAKAVIFFVTLVNSLWFLSGCSNSSQTAGEPTITLSPAPTSTNVAPRPTTGREDELAQAEKEFAAGDGDRALARLKSYLRENPDSLIALVIRAKIYSSIGWKAEASADYAKAIQLEPRTINERFYRAQALGLTSQFDEAIKEYEVAIKEEPSNLILYMYLGELYQKLGTFEKAHALAEQILKIDPKYANGYGLKGNIYISQQRYELAVEAFNKAIQLDSNSSALFNNLAYTYALIDKGSLAVANCLKALDLQANSPTILGTCGLAYYVKGDFQTSLQYFNRVISLYSGTQTPESYCYRGRTHQKLGNQSEAIEDYKACLKYNTGKFAQMAQDGLKALEAK